MKLELLAVLVVSACTIQDDVQPAEDARVAVGPPVAIEFGPGVVIHEVCVVGDAGATIHVGTVGEGTIEPTEARLDTTPPPKDCPTREVTDAATGWRRLRWLSTKGVADASFWQTIGPVTTTPIAVRLKGDAFVGYAVQMPVQPSIDDSGATLALSIAYKEASVLSTAPAAKLAFTIATVPQLAITFPVGETATDGAGQASIVLMRPEKSTAVFITPSGGDPQYVTTLTP